jgi:hypothetical protein
MFLEVSTNIFDVYTPVTAVRIDTSAPLWFLANSMYQPTPLCTLQIFENSINQIYMIFSIQNEYQYCFERELQESGFGSFYLLSSYYSWLYAAYRICPPFLLPPFFPPPRYTVYSMSQMKLVPVTVLP